MTGRTERRLPQWYRDAVNMAYEVTQGDPDRPAVRLSIPYVAAHGRGRGAQSYRRGRMSRQQPPPPPLNVRELPGAGEG